MNVVCQSCQSLVDADKNTACPVCGFALGAAPAASAPIVRPAARPKVLPEIDLAITIDRTGSSLQFADGIRGSLPLMFDPIKARAPKLRVWLQSHGDEDEGQMPVLLTDAGTPEQAADDAKKIIFDGGGDPPEHHASAIENLFHTVSWTANPKSSRGAIVAFLTADTKPSRSGKTPKEIGEAIRAKNLLLFLVCEPTPSLHEMCQAAQGLMFTISKTPSMDDMSKIAAAMAKSIMLTVSTGGTVPMAVPVA